MGVEAKRGNLWPVRVYDPATRRMRYVKGFKDRRRKYKDALALYRELSAQSTVFGVSCEEFASRWTAAYPRSEQTNKHNQERVSLFARDFGAARMDSVTRTKAREWAQRNPGRVDKVTTMFNDALRDGIVQANPFAGLAPPRAPGRRFRPLTEDQLHQLAAGALEAHGEVYGPRLQAMILFAAYTGLRPGELFALQWADIQGSRVLVDKQVNSTVRRVTEPKHGSSGTVALLPPALAALQSLGPQFGEGLIWTTPYGKRFHQQALHRVWHPVRCLYGMPRLRWYDATRHFCAAWMLNVLKIQPWMIAEQLRHSDGGKLILSVYGHPSRREALDEIERVWREANKPQPVREAL